MDTVLADRYRLGERIGTGGSSHVYQAHDDRLDRPVAVKLLDEAAAETADPAARRRFESESRTGAQFFHPNAVAVFDAGSDQGNLFLVMELVTGGSLAERLAAGPLTSRAVAELGAQLASALAAAHSVGIIHRDVKPSNVLLDSSDNAKLADFGIARRFDELEQSLTSTGMVMGTRHYVSPEQARGQPLGAATDIFSLGITLYEAVTGTRPPLAIDRPADDRLDVRALDPTIDPSLATVIERATAIPIEARFADAAQMASALSAAALVPPARFVPAPLDGTAVMPEQLRPQAETTVDPTTPGSGSKGSGSKGSASSGEPPGAPRPLMGGQLHDERRRRERLVRAGAVAAVLLFVVGALVVAFDRDDERDLSAASTTADPATAVTTVAPTTIPPTTSPATTPTTTPAPTTEVATTVPPTTVLTIGQELIPGFAVPVDVEDFLRILLLDPELAGERGDELAEELAKILEGPRGRGGDRAEDLREDVEEWSEEAQLDPIIAAVAIHYIDELSPED